jgi:hypothetical protein
MDCCLLHFSHVPRYISVSLNCVAIVAIVAIVAVVAVVTILNIYVKWGQQFTTNESLMRTTDIIVNPDEKRGNLLIYCWGNILIVKILYEHISNIQLCFIIRTR